MSACAHKRHKKTTTAGGNLGIFTQITHLCTHRITISMHFPALLVVENGIYLRVVVCIKSLPELEETNILCAEVITIQSCRIFWYA